MQPEFKASSLHFRTLSHAVLKLQMGAGKSEINWGTEGGRGQPSAVLRQARSGFPLLPSPEVTQREPGAELGTGCPALITFLHLEEISTARAAKQIPVSKTGGMRTQQIVPCRNSLKWGSLGFSFVSLTPLGRNHGLKTGLTAASCAWCRLDSSFVAQRLPSQPWQEDCSVNLSKRCHSNTCLPETGGEGNDVWAKPLSRVLPSISQVLGKCCYCTASIYLK